MLNSYAETAMKSAVNDLTECFLARVSDRRKQILTGAVCNLLTAVVSVASEVGDSSVVYDKMIEFNTEFMKYWNSKASERGLNNWIRIRRVDVEKE